MKVVNKINNILGGGDLGGLGVIASMKSATVFFMTLQVRMFLCFCESGE